MIISQQYVLSEPKTHLNGKSQQETTIVESSLIHMIHIIFISRSPGISPKIGFGGRVKRGPVDCSTMSTNYNVYVAKEQVEHSNGPHFILVPIISCERC